MISFNQFIENYALWFLMEQYGRRVDPNHLTIC